MDPETRRPLAGIDAVIDSLLHSSFGMVPDDLADAVTLLTDTHTGARDVQLLLVDLDQEVLTPLAGGEPLWVEWSAAGQAFREEQPVVERTPLGRRLWLPILDSAERVGVLGLTAGEDVAIDDWLSLTSLLGELVVSKEKYGDVIAEVRRRRPVSVAAEMRWSMLPPLTFSSPIVGVSGILQPSYGVAGDAFDYAVDRTHATVAIFDAMGHGMHASRLANLAVGSFRSLRRGGASPEAALVEMDSLIEDQFEDVAFVTAQIVTLDLETGVARVRSAGHPPPVRLRAGTAPQVLTVSPGLPLGLGPSRYPASEVQLEEGDAILLVSDGVYEARSPDDQQFGWDRMVDVVQERFDAGDRLPEVLRRAVRDVMTFQRREPQDERRRNDDATMVLVRWCPASAGQPAEPRASEQREAEGQRP